MTASEIIPGSLYLGDVHDGKNASESFRDYDTIVSIGPQMEHEGTDYHFEIPDGGYTFNREDHYPVFKDAVNTVRAQLEEGRSVLVHCNAGQSRSPAVAIAAIATFRGMDFHETYNAVQDQRSSVHLSVELRYCAKRYVEAYDAIHNT